MLGKYNHDKLSDGTVALYNALKACEVLRGKIWVARGVAGVRAR